MGIGKIKFIDLKGVNFDTTAESAPVVPGIYDAFEGAVGKMIVVANLIVDGVEVGTAAVSPRVVESNIVVQMAGFELTISADDEVVLTTASGSAFPELPEEDGTFNLVVVIEDGVAEICWMEQE